MRLSRLLLVFVLSATVSGLVVPSASALTYLDEICVVEPGGFVRVCPQGETGKAYQLELKGREGCWPYVSFRATGTLPPGLTLSSNGLISGTPTQQGTWEAWIEMKNVPASEGGVSWCGDSHATERLFRFTILQGLQIVQRASTLTAAQLNTAYSLQLSTTGATSPTWSVSSGSLPAGITLNNSTGLLAGPPTATGDFTFKITATEGNRSDSQTYTLTVVEQLKISRAAMPAAEVGLPYTADLEATGGRPAHSWTVEGALPAGLTLDAATGLISGKPTAAGSYPLKLTVTDALGLRADVNVTLKVAAKLAITKNALPAAKVGKKYKARFLARGGVAPTKWIILGGRPGLLPAGIKLNAKTGELSGTPTKAGTFRLRMQVVDKLGVKSALGLVLKVNA
jgi:large repetitive protein